MTCVFVGTTKKFWGEKGILYPSIADAKEAIELRVMRTSSIKSEERHIWSHKMIQSLRAIEIEESDERDIKRILKIANQRGFPNRAIKRAITMRKAALLLAKTEEKETRRSSPDHLQSDQSSKIVPQDIPPGTVVSTESLSEAESSSKLPLSKLAWRYNFMRSG